MAASTNVRVEQAVRLLLQGRSAPGIVAELAEIHGISVRTARRVVARAYGVIQADLEQTVDKKALTAQLVHAVQTAMAQALASGHSSAVVGCCRELRELLGLGPSQATPGRHR